MPVQRLGGSFSTKTIKNIASIVVAMLRVKKIMLVLVNFYFKIFTQ